MYCLSTRVRVIHFWLGDFTAREVRDDDVAETVMTNMRPSKTELV